MSQFYYLISSLPMLELNEPLLMDSSTFSDSCSTSLSSKEMQLIERLSIVPADSNICDDLSEWNCWETLLRNRLVAQRSVAVDDAEKYLREEYDYFSEIEKGVQEAFLKPDPLERENHLDKMRWEKLENLEVGHEFDFTKLCIYKLKLMLCEKRQDRNKEKGSENYDDIVKEIYGKDPLASPQIRDW